MKCREPHADIKIEVNKNNRGTRIFWSNFHTCSNTYILGLNEVKTTHQLP